VLNRMSKKDKLSTDKIMEITNLEEDWSKYIYDILPEDLSNITSVNHLVNILSNELSTIDDFNPEKIEDICEAIFTLLNEKNEDEKTLKKTNDVHSNQNQSVFLLGCDDSDVAFFRSCR